MRESIFAFLDGHQLPRAKYHETLTQAWVLEVSHCMQRHSSQSFDEFAQHSAEFFDSTRMSQYYSPALMQSDVARASFVEPNVQQFLF